jgi:hypothetical protein
MFCKRGSGPVGNLDLLGLGASQSFLRRLADLLESLPLGSATSLARLLVVGRPLHFGTDSTSLDELLESFKGALDVLARTKPHSQNPNPPALESPRYLDHPTLLRGKKNPAFPQRPICRILNRHPQGSKQYFPLFFQIVNLSPLGKGGTLHFPQNRV